MIEKYVVGVESSWDVQKQEKFLDPHIDRSKWNTVKMDASHNLFDKFFSKSSQFVQSKFFPCENCAYMFSGLYKDIPVFVNIATADEMLTITKAKL